MDWTMMSLGLFGGLALFLAGLNQLSDGLKHAAGRTLNVLLGRLTTNRFSGAVTGAVVTGVLNSSSVTTVLVVGFVTAGVMSLQQSVGVILGANVGSTVTAQLLAFDIASYALAPVAIGFALLTVGRRDMARQLGEMIMGLGLVFFGMGLMSDAMGPLRGYEPFVELLGSLESPILGLLAGALFTALVQSSAATVGIAIALASEGLLTLEGGITLALGANIGTCATALLASLGKPASAVRATLVHMGFNVIGALLWLPALGVLAELATWASPQSPGLSGAARAAAEVPRQLANANTLFNVINTALFLPFTGLIARAAERLVREPPPVAVTTIEPRYLDEAALAVPTLALENARRETGRLAELVQRMMVELGLALRDLDQRRLDALGRMADDVAVLQSAIFGYMGTLRTGPLNDRESAQIQVIMEAVVCLESLSEVIARDFGHIGRAAGSRRASTETREMIIGLFESAQEAVAAASRAVRDEDTTSAQVVLDMRDHVHDQVSALLARQARRLRPGDPDYLLLARLQMSAVDKLTRIYDLSAQMARSTLPAPSTIAAGGEGPQVAAGAAAEPPPADATSGPP